MQTKLETKREVICADTKSWIKDIADFSLDAIITSLPDKEETNLSLEEWEDWFVNMVGLVIWKTKSYAIFYQTDRKVDGHLLDKSYLLNLGAKAVGAKLLWHKIVLKRGVGVVDLFRPTYTHMLCFSFDHKSGKATPDVIQAGKMMYKNAMGLEACEFAVNFIKNNSDAKMIADPFCGQGSVLKVANDNGFDSLGVDILSEQCELAKKI